nr:MAG TPA: hypothetical protein [Caudoviricetes sp.]DAK04698.1 MAG TPA: hypothetical protein [Caudoviricetes sp.]DAL90794.1 MAG TPA: hypothetical protein [Caudoviricetes sp.]DAM18426.1 MAG TPA: hypothetical protein [Caudoviricetes sp.]DAN50904.1 MAG TPA: hypothetical protein [Caudoviricetes sp.]
MVIIFLYNSPVTFIDHVLPNLCYQFTASFTDSILPVLIVLHSHSPDMHHCLFRAQRYGGKRCSSTAVAT